MRKMLLTPLIVCMVALLSMLSIPVHAITPIPVEGYFDYYYAITDVRVSEEGNTFLYATEWETWKGDFEGTAVAVFRVGIFLEEPAVFWNVWLRSTLTGTVDGKSGTLVIELVGKKPLGEDWYGQWMIISGTGDLANLHGRGTWWGPGFEDANGNGVPDSGDIPGARPDIWYSSEIHFD